MAELNGWQYPARYGEFMAAVHTRAYIDVHSKKPSDLPFPWDKVQEEEPVAPEERARLLALLEKHSAFAT